MGLFWKIFVFFTVAMTVTLVGVVFVSFRLASTALDQVNVEGRDKIIDRVAVAGPSPVPTNQGAQEGWPGARGGGVRDARRAAVHPPQRRGRHAGARLRRDGRAHSSARDREGDVAARRLARAAFAARAD